MPFSYALAALLASAPVTGLVMSTPASLPPAQAQRAARRSALAVVDLIVSFPRHAQRLRRGRGRMALGDERPEQALFLPLIRGLAATQAPFQRAIQPERRPQAQGEQPQGLVEGGISRHPARIGLKTLDLEVVVRAGGGGLGR